MRKETNVAYLTFREASEIWLDSRLPFLAPRTQRDYAEYIKALMPHFGDLKLSLITTDDIRKYQRARMQTCGPSRINQEISCLQQLLKRIKRWPDLQDDYQALPKPKESPGRALSDSERERLFRYAMSNPCWEMAYLFAVLSVNTSAGPKECWTLRLQDVCLEGANPRIRVQPEGAKNVHRVRIIPLNELALAAVHRLLELAQKRGAREPHHYLFPFRVVGNAYGGTYDPTMHCTTCKTAWRKLIIAANLKGLRPYDLRHTAITDLLSDPEVSEETCEAIAGHITPRMKKNYSHIRMDAMKIAVDSLVKADMRRRSANNRRKKPSTYAQLNPALEDAEVIRKNLQ